ncbi:MAG: S-methyl-5-thioribose-1-phosphate isomerase [Leptospiraceae bacterium]|nr:S-methyl-5-thioribose-1-phosphate isomerase [Leptospiraceae bacterium]
MHAQTQAESLTDSDFEKLEGEITPGCRFTEEGRLFIVDQTLLPTAFKEIELTDVDATCEAIRSLRIRGAPGIAIVAAFAFVRELKSRLTRLGLKDSHTLNATERSDLFEYFVGIAERLENTRPTAVNLSHAMRDMIAALEHSLKENISAAKLMHAMRERANRIYTTDRDQCRRIGNHGQSIIPNGARILTICNTGALATAGIGTALGIIYTANYRGRVRRVYACETRPLLQGARLTAWELHRAELPVTLIGDSMAAQLMSTGKVDLVLAGADRIARNGDTANKIGTQMLAILAKHYAIPFYIAAPGTTLDGSLPDGTGIPIEERSADELRRLAGVPTAPGDVSVYNPAFDVTPADCITGIITDSGLFKPPFNFAKE